MPRILLTAYEPYDDWQCNASHLVLEQLQASSAGQHEVTTRVYPVAFRTIHELIQGELTGGYDFAIHMGQAPGYSDVTLEAIGINVAVDRGQKAEEGVPLVSGGAAAYQSPLPLSAWAAGLRTAGIPARVSYHAGTFLCNAALYLSSYEAEQRRLKTKSVFLHLPLAAEQAEAHERGLPTLPAETMAGAVRWILRQLL